VLRIAVPLLLAGSLLSAGVAASPSHAAVTPSRVVDRTVCKHVGTTRARCLAIRVDHVHRGRIRHESTPIGYGPADLAAAYALPRANGARAIVAIVDAYDDPTAERDLGVYRSQFHLPSCTTANHCFRKVDQTGGTSYPQADGGWAEEPFTGTGFPRVFYLKYHMYSVYFPLMALGRYLREVVSHQFSVVSKSRDRLDVRHASPAPKGLSVRIPTED